MVRFNFRLHFCGIILSGGANEIVDDDPYIRELVREILGNGTIGTDFWLALVASLVILVVFVPLTLWAYKRNA